MEALCFVGSPSGDIMTNPALKAMIDLLCYQESLFFEIRPQIALHSFHHHRCLDRTAGYCRCPLYDIEVLHGDVAKGL